MMLLPRYCHSCSVTTGRQRTDHTPRSAREVSGAPVLLPSRAVSTWADPPAFLLSTHCYNPLNHFIKSPHFPHSEVSPRETSGNSPLAPLEKKRKVNNSFKDGESSFQAAHTKVSQDTGNSMGSTTENPTGSGGTATQETALLLGFRMTPKKAAQTRQHLTRW